MHWIKYNLRAHQAARGISVSCTLADDEFITRSLGCVGVHRMIIAVIRMPLRDRSFETKSSSYTNTLHAVVIWVMVCL